ncbi:MAG: hypothetical protein PVG36_08760 [Methyloceanibacter sp.]
MIVTILFIVVGYSAVGSLELGEGSMRLLLLLIVVFTIMALIQSKRHGCKFGIEDWFSCVVDNTTKEYYSALTPNKRLTQLNEARASSM